MGGRPPVFDLPPLPVAIVVRRGTRDDEVADLKDLLTEHADTAAGTAADIAAMAERVAVASLGDDHLWQDLQLGSRAELSLLMNHWFPRLAARNNRDMKWKKFLYKQLCDKAELSICRAPSCDVCSDYARCFGPEEAPSS